MRALVIVLAAGLVGCSASVNRERPATPRAPDRRPIRVCAEVMPSVTVQAAAVAVARCGFGEEVLLHRGAGRYAAWPFPMVRSGLTYRGVGAGIDCPSDGPCLLLSEGVHDVTIRNFEFSSSGSAFVEVRARPNAPPDAGPRS